MAADDKVESPNEGQSDISDTREMHSNGRKLEIGQLATDKALGCDQVT